MSELAELARDEIPSSSPGEMLARERVKKAMSVAEIAAQLRYSTKQIEALEGDDYARLPGTTFVRGMIRGYAKIVGAQAAPIIEAMEKRHIPSPITTDLRATRVPFPDGKARSTKVYVWLCVAVLTVVSGVVYEWHFGLPQLFMEQAPMSQPDGVEGGISAAPAQAANISAQANGSDTGIEPGTESSKRVQAVTVIPVPSSPVSISPIQDNPAPSVLVQIKPVPIKPSVPASTIPVSTISASTITASTIPVSPIVRDAPRLRFEFQKDAWVEVKERGGRTLIAQINPGGTQSIVQGTPPFVLIIGNATNVRVTYGDKPVDLAQHIKFDVARFTLE